MDEPNVCPPDHKHGDKSTCYTLHACRCASCREAHRDQMYYRRHMLATNNEDRLDQLVDATPTRRRVQALMALGWSQVAIAELTSTQQSLLSDALYYRQIRRSTATRIADIYEQFSGRIPPTATKSERISVARTKALAARRGYIPPLAWDDIDTDPHPPVVDDSVRDIDVVAVDLAIAGQRPSLLTREERHQVVRVLHRHGHFDSVIAAACGVTTKTIERDRQELGLPGIPQDGRNTREASAA